MKKTLLLLTVIIFSNSYGQTSLWNKISEDRIGNSPKMERASMPNKYQLFSLNLNSFKNSLNTAPKDTDGVQSNVIIKFPNAEGQLENYRVYESPVMEDGLAVQYQNLKTYSAKGIDDPTASMRLSITPFGLHTMTFSGKSSVNYIDTYTSDLNTYIVYNRSDLTNNRSFECLFDESEAASLKTTPLLERTGDSNYRVYRLAMACTGEYATFHGGTVNSALAAMVVTVNRVNALYQKDLAVRLVLVANNNLLVYTNATTDPYTNTNGGAMLGQNQTTVTTIIGSANYDIGHVVSTGGGGVAGLGVVCVAGQKARGVTGSPAPVGDPFDIDYVAHEMGHQFGCNHTFNGDQGGCAGNRNDATAVEPGSGSTIMAYAGLCSPQDVQGNSDSHFSYISISEATNTILGTATCATITANGNLAPVVDAGLDYTIPRGTAFILKGTAVDAVDAANLTYCWEQSNPDVSTQPPLQTSVVGPNFRSRPPVASSERYMPEIQSVISNNLAPTWEVISTVARTFDFALTVRDNRSVNGGQTGRDDMRVTVANVGPFLVNAPNTFLSWAIGSNQTVTWTVAGTTANGINATFVDIFLSTNGGLTYPILLASKVPNDGSETITVPNNPGSQNRIMVRGYKHIFYDISNTNFTISAATSTFGVAFSGVAEQQNKSACQGSIITYNISYTALAGFSGTTTFSATGNPPGSVVTFSPASTNTSGTVVMTISNTSSSAPGLYNVIVSATSGATTKTAPFYFNLFSSVFPAMVLSTPANNATGQSSSLTLTWVANSNATSYDVQVSNSAAFTTIVSSGTATTPSFNVTGLNINTDYFWRVLPKNDNCGGVYSSAFTFRTGLVSCNSVSSTNVPVAISATGTPTITSTINIPTSGTITDVNITMNVTHTWINDLVATLTSPAGTVINLFTNPCDPNSSINDIAATFDDAGVALACGNSPGISGLVIPETPLSDLNGETPTGVWTLTIFDAFNQDGGSLNSWSLAICAALPLSITDNTLQNFAVYPNPNNGNFNVQFTSNSTNEVKVYVYDMRGRLILENSYANNALFNENIQLNNAQAGVYLLSVVDGDKKVAKKIVVE